MDIQKQQDLLVSLTNSVRGINQLLAKALICQPKERTSELEFTLVESHNALTQLHFHLLTILNRYQSDYIVTRHKFLTINQDNSITHTSFEPMENNTVH